jgi:lysophospholipase L1-like esterase
MSLFPRGKTGEMINARVRDLNAALGAWGLGAPELLHLDIGARFLDERGEVDTRLMPDGTHPSKAGYEIWADSIEPFIQQHVK